MEIEERKDALKFLKTGALFFSFWYRGGGPNSGVLGMRRIPPWLKPESSDVFWHG